MGDILKNHAVCFSDYNHEEIIELQKQLEYYMIHDSNHPVIIDLKVVKIRVQGSDEVSCLYRYLNERL